MTETNDCPMLSQLLELVTSKLCSLREEKQHLQQELEDLEHIRAAKKNKLEELAERKLLLETQIRDFKNQCEEERRKSCERQKEIKSLLQQTLGIKSKVQSLKQLKALILEASVQEEKSRLKDQEASSNKTQVDAAHGKVKEEYCKALTQCEFLMGENTVTLQSHWTEAREAFQILEDSCKSLIENSTFL